MKKIFIGMILLIESSCAVHIANPALDSLESLCNTGTAEECSQGIESYARIHRSKPAGPAEEFEKKANEIVNDYQHEQEYIKLRQQLLDMQLYGTGGRSW